MVDIAVKSGAAWVCQASGRLLPDVLLPVHLGEEEEASPSGWDGTGEEPVLLQQTEDGSPCVLTLRCSPGSQDAIGRLLVVSEARTMELYDQSGEYCGTVRGERDERVQPPSDDRGPFYRKQLILEQPTSACEVKLLSLAGRGSVLVSRVGVGLRPLRAPVPAPGGPGIDMQQVQSLVEEMGTSLSPGAQSLMDMVHFQQKNQTGSLGGLLPLLMGGGGLSVLSQGANLLSAAAGGHTRPGESTPPAALNGATSTGSSSCSPDSPESGVNSCDSASSDGRGRVSHPQLAEMMSHLLRGQRSEALDPELLPVLQSVCGQVTQLRLDEAERERERASDGSTWELDSAMERRLEEMERRLKEHVDRRLDALEQRLEKVLLSALQGGGGGGGGGGEGGGGAGPVELTAPTPATN